MGKKTQKLTDVMNGMSKGKKDFFVRHEIMHRDVAQACDQKKFDKEFWLQILPGCPSVKMLRHMLKSRQTDPVYKKIDPQGLVANLIQEEIDRREAATE